MSIEDSVCEKKRGLFVSEVYLLVVQCSVINSVFIPIFEKKARVKRGCVSLWFHYACNLTTPKCVSSTIVFQWHLFQVPEPEKEMLHLLIHRLSNFCLVLCWVLMFASLSWFLLWLLFDDNVTPSTFPSASVFDITKMVGLQDCCIFKAKM